MPEHPRLAGQFSGTQLAFYLGERMRMFVLSTPFLCACLPAAVSLPDGTGTARPARHG